MKKLVVIALLLFGAVACTKETVTVTAPPATTPSGGVTPNPESPAPAASEPQAPVSSGADMNTSAPQPKKPSYTVVSGDTLSGRFGKEDGQKVCDANRDVLTQGCHKIYPGQVLKLPEGVEPRARLIKAAPRAVQPKAAQAVPVAPSQPKRVPSVVRVRQDDRCIMLGVAPYNPEHRLPRLLEGIDELERLSPALKVRAKEMVSLGAEPEKLLIKDHVFAEMLYKSKKTGKTIHVFGKQVCNPEQGGVPEAMLVYELGTDEAGNVVYLALPLKCGNPGIIIGPPRREEPPAVVTPPPPTVTEPPAVVEPPEAKVVVRNHDWDLGLYLGGDRDVTYAGYDGAFYPKLVFTKSGRHAFGIGSTGDAWKGETPAPQSFSFEGTKIGVGPAYKFSSYERRDFTGKLMLAWLRESGHNGDGYEMHRKASLICAALSYNDAAREKNGETILPEWQVWLTFCEPMGGVKASHSFQGSPISDTKAIEALNYLLSVGGRVYLCKDFTCLFGESEIAKKLQPFIELGANRTSPFPWSYHAYVGVRTKNKVLGVGVGLHWNKTAHLIGATVTYDVGRHGKIVDEEERWDAMVKSLNALGIATD